MNKQHAILLFFVLCLLLSCKGNTVKNDVVISVAQDAKKYLHDGVYAYHNARWTKAQRLFQQALLLYQSVDNQQGVLHSYINLSEVALALRHFTQSKQYLAHAATRAKYANSDYANHNARISLLYALIALRQNQLVKAIHKLQAILPAFTGVIADSVPNNIQIVAIASRTEIAFLQKKQAELWTRRYANALPKMVYQSTNNKARLLRFQADLLVQQGTAYAINKATTKMQQALSLYQQNQLRTGIASTLLALAQHYKNQQRWQQAQDYLQRSLAVYNFLGNNKQVQLITAMLQAMPQ